MKFNNIVGRGGDFGGSITTVQEDIVTVLAKGDMHKKNDDDRDNNPTKRNKPERPLYHAL